MLAKLLAMVADIGKKKTDPPSDMYDFAPWLEEPGKRIERIARHEKRQKEIEHLRAVERADAVRAAYQHTKKLREDQAKKEQGNG